MTTVLSAEAGNEISSAVKIQFAFILIPGRKKNTFGVFFARRIPHGRTDRSFFNIYANGARTRRKNEIMISDQQNCYRLFTSVAAATAAVAAAFPCNELVHSAPPQHIHMQISPQRATETKKKNAGNLYEKLRLMQVRA